MNTLKLLAKVLIPVLILATAVIASRVIQANRPEPGTRPERPTLPTVEATRLAPASYPVVIRSQGTVSPTLANTLVPEVAGTVVAVSEHFVVGGSFKAGEVLLQIDERDYSIALTRARANLAQADAQLKEQQAQSTLAAAEWKTLGRGGKASDLTLRVPQLAASRAALAAARAEVQRAELDLERSRIIAPYDGQVLERNVDPGQFVARGNPVGRIHATDEVDIRLPLTSRQLTWLDLPASRDDRPVTSGDAPTDDAPPMNTPQVELTALVGGRQRSWSGRLIRAEGLDATTQQLTVIARVAGPYKDPAKPLRIGQFVEARITGSVLDEVFVIPRAALREDREVLVLNEANEVYRRAVDVAWTDEQVAAVSDGLVAGEVLVLTPLATVADGTPVRATIDGVTTPLAEDRGKPARPSPES